MSSSMPETLFSRRTNSLRFASGLNGAIFLSHSSQSSISPLVQTTTGATETARLYTREEALGRPSPVPAGPGIYAWFFDELPDHRIDAKPCVRRDGWALLYVGIAPKPPPSNGAPASKQGLRARIRQHYALNAAGSTLRLTLGCLLSNPLGIELRRVGSGKRLTFTAEGESRLSAWMGAHARVAWAETEEPWVWEERALATLDLPLNLQANQRHPFCGSLSASRAAARARARSLPVA